MTAKTALITGANKGVGFEIAMQLGKKGFQIILSGRNKERLENAARLLVQEGISVVPLVMDVSTIVSIHSAYSSIADTISSIDVFVNNAGILLDENISLLNISHADFLQTFNTNSFAGFFTVQAFLPLLKNGSKVINISSSGGQIINGITTWAPVYCMSKTMLNIITMQLAESLKHKGISVNAVCPGWVRTDMGGMIATRSVAEGAETIVWLATNKNNMHTGKFFRDREEISW